MSVIWSNEVDDKFSEYFWTPEYEDRRDKEAMPPPCERAHNLTASILTGVLLVIGLIWKLLQ